MCGNLVSWGMDMTLKFEWIDGDWNSTAKNIGNFN